MYGLKHGFHYRQVCVERKGYDEYINEFLIKPVPAATRTVARHAGSPPLLPNVLKDAIV
jgi:hypothetical protein